MRVAALMLGVIGGLFAMLIGFFSYGYTELASQHAAFAETFGAVDNPDLIRTASFLAPLLAIAGSMIRKPKSATTSGTFPTHGPLFVTLLTLTILLIGGLTFLPALALGPIAEHLGMLAQ